jgi:hypothetical protein
MATFGPDTKSLLQLLADADLPVWGQNGKQVFAVRSNVMSMREALGSSSTAAAAAAAARANSASRKGQQRAARNMRDAVYGIGIVRLLSTAVARGLRLVIAAKQQGSEVSQAAASALLDAQSAAALFSAVWVQRCLDGEDGMGKREQQYVVQQASDPGKFARCPCVDMTA